MGLAPNSAALRRFVNSRHLSWLRCGAKSQRVSIVAARSSGLECSGLDRSQAGP